MNQGRKVIIIRPEEDNIFKEAMSSILSSIIINKDTDVRLLGEGIISTLEFLFIVKAVDESIPDISKK